MISHRGFSAWVTCEGKPLPEYEVNENETTHRVTCWIPSTTGQCFSVHWRDEGGGIDTAAYINLDGTVVAGRFLFGHGEAYRDGFRTGATTERPFIFSKVDISSESESTLSNKHKKEVGTIMLRIKRIKRTASKLANRIQHIPTEVRSRSREHCIGYGPERSTYEQYSTTWSFSPYDSSSPGSYVTFIFRYRSAEFLISEGIMTAADLSNLTSSSPENAYTPLSTDGLTPPPNSADDKGYSSSNAVSGHARSVPALLQPPSWTHNNESSSARSLSPVPTKLLISEIASHQQVSHPPSIQDSGSAGLGVQRTVTRPRSRSRAASYVEAMEKEKHKKLSYTQREAYPGEGMLLWNSTTNAPKDR